MKTLFRNLFLLLSGLWLHCQTLAQDYIKADYSLAHGNLPTEENGYVELRLACSANDGTIIYKSEDIRGPGGRRYFLEKYDQDMKRVVIKEYSGVNENAPFILNIVAFNGKLYALNGITDESIPERESHTVYISELDQESLELTKERQLFKFEQAKSTGLSFDLDVSNDGQTIAVLAAQYTGIEKIVNFHVATLNSTFEVTSNYTGELTYGSLKGDRPYRIELFTLNSGKVILPFSAEIIQEGSEYNPIHDYFIGLGNKHELNFERFNVLDHQMTSAVFALSEKEDFFAGGYYFTHLLGHAEGSQTLKFDLTTGTVSSVSKSAFTKEYTLLQLNDRETEKAMEQNSTYGVIGISLLVPKDFVSHGDGSMSLTGQVEMGSIRKDAKTGTLIVYPDIYETRHIHVTRLDANGTAQYHDKMAKITILTDIYLRFRAFDYKNELVVFCELPPEHFYEDYESLPKSTKLKLRGKTYSIGRFRTYENFLIEGKNTIEALYVNALEERKFGDVYYESHIKTLDNGGIFVHCRNDESEHWGVLFTPNN